MGKNASLTLKAKSHLFCSVPFKCYLVSLEGKGRRHTCTHILVFFGKKLVIDLNCAVLFLFLAHVSMCLFELITFNFDKSLEQCLQEPASIFTVLVPTPMLTLFLIVRCNYFCKNYQKT